GCSLCAKSLTGQNYGRMRKRPKDSRCHDFEKGPRRAGGGGAAADRPPRRNPRDSTFVYRPRVRLRTSARPAGSQVGRSGVLAISLTVWKISLATRLAFSASIVSGSSDGWW